MFGSWGIGLVLAVQNSAMMSTKEKEKALIGRSHLVQALYKVWLHMGCTPKSLHGKLDVPWEIRWSDWGQV